MKKGFIIISLLMFCTTSVFAADFAPTLLKLSADPIVQYDFDGSQLSIPVQVSGTAAGIVFCVFTRGQADNILNTTNGFLGWHYVNKVDTCLYYSAIQSVSTGANTVAWDGKDQDGGVVPAGEYTYYLWAFDNQGAKTQMGKYLSFGRDVKIHELDESSLPLSNPLWYNFNTRWSIGSDPLDSALVETTTLNLAEDWITVGAPGIDPKDFDFFYIAIRNQDAASCGLQNLKWVPGGDSEIQTDFGEDGLSDTFAFLYWSSTGSSGVTVDGDYIYTSDRNGTGTDPDSDFYIYDLDGTQVEWIDLTDWFTSSEDMEAGGQMNGGPSYFSLRDGMIFMNHYGCCLHMLVNPTGYLESGDTEDFFLWANDNGDYVLDHNFEETSARPWVCADFNVGPYIYTYVADANHFSVGIGYDAGAVSFGLLAPDGTGLGYHSYAGETAGWKRSTLFVDADTPFDGIYCDNMQTGGPHYEWDEDKADVGIFFIGHDSITGVITSGVGVEEDTPAAFSVAQNSPNPFNPATTISFSLAEAGNVNVEVYNVAGQKVDTIANGFMNAGSHSVVWDASDFSAGVYFYTVKSDGFSRTMKMTLLK